MQQHQKQYRIAGVSFEAGHGRLVVGPSPGYVFWQLLPAAIGGWVLAWLLAQGFSSPAGSAGPGGGGRSPPAALYPSALAALAAVGGSAHALHLLRRRYVFDRGTGAFRREDRPLCPLAAIRRLEIEPTTATGGRAAPARPYYRLSLCYATGSVYPATQGPRLGRVFLFEFDSPGRARKVAREMAHFVGVPVLDLEQGAGADGAVTAVAAPAPAATARHSGSSPHPS